MPARLVRFMDNELVKRTESHAVLRSGSEPKAAIDEVALVFGVCLRKYSRNDFKNEAVGGQGTRYVPGGGRHQ